MQISRRIWWSVYSLDRYATTYNIPVARHLLIRTRVTSICLGRPMAVHDEDCYCEMPLNMSDDLLEQYSRALIQRAGPNHPIPSEQSSPLSGFLAFARLCRITGRIQRLNSPHSIRRLASTSPSKARRFVSRVAAYDRSLRAWLESLPEDVRFSASRLEGGAEQNGSLAMCAIIFIVHAGSLLNLYR